MIGSRLQVYIIVGLALAGVCALVFATKLGIGLSPDSTVYVQSARNILDGKGVSDTLISGKGKLEPLTHFPPLFPSVLAFLGLFGLDPVVGARWLCAFLFGGTIALTGMFVRRYAGEKSWAPVVASMIILTSYALARLHAIALSEPLFLFLALLALFLLIRYIETRKTLPLVGAGVAVALACLTRYGGVVLILTGIVGVTALGRVSPWKRLRDAAAFGVISALPLVLWCSRNLYLAGSATNKSLGFHPCGLTRTLNVMLNTTSWLWPFEVAQWLKWVLLSIILAGLGFLCLAFWRSGNRGAEEPAQAGTGLRTAAFLLMFYAIMHVILLYSATTFLCNDLSMGNRLMSPTYLAGAVGIVLMLHGVLQSPSRWLTKRLLLPVLVALLIAHFLHTAEWAEDARKEGTGYASKAWQESETVQRVRELDPETIIYTNGPDALYVLTGRVTRMLPRKKLAATKGVNPDYSREIEEVERAMREDGAVLVYIKLIRWRWYLPAKREIEAELPCRMTAKTRDGFVYMHRLEEKVMSLPSN